jgi:hypothetical protein
MTLEEAIKFQFYLVEQITREIPGELQLEAGDYGVVRGLGRPRATDRDERAVARIFDAEAAALVRGAGTGGIRMALQSFVRAGDTIVLHRPPVYATSDFTIESLGLKRVHVNLNDLDALAQALKQDVKVLYIQTTYQHEDDAYSVADIAAVARQSPSRPRIVTDDNYAAFNAPKIGCQLGSDLSTFSFFKALGPEGVGCVIGKRDLIERIHELNYSGGTQVQGPEAMDAIRSVIALPVQAAIGRNTIDEVVRRWPNEGVEGVWVGYRNIQGFHVAAIFDDPIAVEVADMAVELGAVPHPVGAGSRYEFGPMFYRPSRSLLERDPEAGKRMVRVGANRAGPDQIIDLLRQATLAVRSKQLVGAR